MNNLYFDHSNKMKNVHNKHIQIVLMRGSNLVQCVIMLTQSQKNSECSLIYWWSAECKLQLLYNLRLLICMKYSVVYWRHTVTEPVGGLSVHYDRTVLGVSLLQTVSSINAVGPL